MENLLVLIITGNITSLTFILTYQGYPTITTLLNGKTSMAPSVLGPSRGHQQLCPKTSQLRFEQTQMSSSGLIFLSPGNFQLDFFNALNDPHFMYKLFDR
jgi:hypothetical protein